MCHEAHWITRGDDNACLAKLLGDGLDIDCRVQFSKHNIGLYPFGINRKPR
ncbi:Uncharacterised protein [Vibrio cholerae]|nr:Uncharacterised protein [Vibrio cholerae]